MKIRDKIKLKQIIKMFIENIRKDNLGNYSAMCSYYTILSFIPFLILLIVVLQYTSVDKENIEFFLLRLMPKNTNNIVTEIVEEIYSKSIGTISVTLIFTIWSAGKGFFSLMKGLNNIYKANEKKKNSYMYLRIKSLIKTILFIFIFVIAIMTLVFGRYLISMLEIRFKIFQKYNFLIKTIGKFGILFFLFIIFILLYRYIPQKKQTYKSQWIGAMFTALAININSFIYAQYIDIFKEFSIVYSKITAIVLILTWIYICFYIIFIGAEINKTLELIKE